MLKGIFALTSSHSVIL